MIWSEKREQRRCSPIYAFDGDPDGNSSLGSKERLYRELLWDARKEYTAEGQLFYMYKRLNRNITVDGKTYGMSKNFVFPLPEVEH